MILDATTKTIELLLGSAVTTTAMPITADYVDMTTTTTLAGSSDTQSNGVTAVTIVAAPAASTQRKINSITVYNADTAAKVVTIRLNNNTTLRNLISVNLQVGYSIIYTDTRGFYLIDANGNILVSPLSSMTSAQLAALLSDETGTGLVVFDTSPTITTPSIVSPTISGAAGNLYSSIWTATLTNVTNISSSSAFVNQFVRIGLNVIVSGRVTIDPTIAGAIELGVSLPVASNFSAAQNAGGTFANATGDCGLVDADSTNDRFRFRATVADASSQDYFFSAMYRII